MLAISSSRFDFRLNILKSFMEISNDRAGGGRLERVVSCLHSVRGWLRRRRVKCPIGGHSVLESEVVGASLIKQAEQPTALCAVG